MIVKYQILNIDCAVCAQEISKAISQMKEINNANVDFVNNLIYLDVDKEPDSYLLDKIQNKIDYIEDGVKIVPLKNDESDKKNVISKDIKIIILSGVIFLVSLLFSSINSYIYLILSLIAVILCGYDIFKKGILSIFKLNFDEKSLMTIAVIAAFVIGDFAEGFFVILLFKIGNILEKLAVTRSRKRIKSLAEIVPDTAFLLTEDGETKVSSSELKIGDIIKIHPFDKIPADGIVIEGVSSVNPSAITGESIPIDVSKGDKILSGMINNSGTITLKVINTANESAANKIMKMIEESAMKKTNTENIISRFAKIYTPIVIVLAALLCIIPPLFLSGNFDLWFRRALVFLVASCPCAIVISVPLAFYSGVGISSKFGVLFKGSKYIEALSIADTIVFDKTATLTTGILSIDKIHIFDSNFNENSILQIASAVEQYSNHPVATAIKNATTSISNPYTATQLTELAGFGVSAYIDDKEILCGNRKLFLNNNYNMDNFMDFPLYISVNGKIIGAIEFSDTLRDCIQSTIFELKNLGIKNLVILSGDSENEVKKVAEKCHIDKYYSKLLPENKLTIFNEIKKHSRKSVFIGDGINDTPTLAAADCGIAMGQGSTAAIETGDVVFLNNNIDKLPTSIKLSRKIMSIVKFNISFALFIKVIVLLLASFGMAPMWSAILADTGVTLISIFNASPKRIKY